VLSLSQGETARPPSEDQLAARGPNSARWHGCRSHRGTESVQLVLSCALEGAPVGLLAVWAGRALSDARHAASKGNGADTRSEHSMHGRLQRSPGRDTHFRSTPSSIPSGSVYQAQATAAGAHLRPEAAAVGDIDPRAEVRPNERQAQSVGRSRIMLVRRSLRPTDRSRCGPPSRLPSSAMPIVPADSWVS